MKEGSLGAANKFMINSDSKLSFESAISYFIDSNFPGKELQESKSPIRRVKQARHLKSHTLKSSVHAGAANAIALRPLLPLFAHKHIHHCP
jgi:hypothetical protein